MQTLNTFTRRDSRNYRSFSNAARPKFRGKRVKFSSRKPKHGGRIDPAKFVNRAIHSHEAEAIEIDIKYQDFNIDQRLRRKIVNKGYTKATPIQAQAIPVVLKGIDVVGIADTGTGKTAAFLVPLINKVLSDKKSRILIVSPTRELATQIDDEFKSLSGGLSIFSACCIGGTNIGRQIKELRYFNNFVIGTPGRLKDLVDRHCIKLAEFNTIVLDEADRMMDMGFINDMRFLMGGMPKVRQTLFFSATLSREIDKLIGEFLTNPTKIWIKSRDTSKNVDQDVVKVGGKDKMEVLQDLLSQQEFNKVLIFGRTKYGVERLSNNLVKKGFKSESIHGNKSYAHRQKALDMFKTNHINILVATDVAARGLDIDGVSHVINFDLPQTYEDYIHRIGRTGRGDKFGKALTFID